MFVMFDVSLLYIYGISVVPLARSSCVREQFNFLLYLLLIFCFSLLQQLVLGPPCFFFFFWERFNLWRPLLMIALYHQTKTPINFWCRRRLNPKSLIQPSEILPIELTGTHLTLLVWLRLCLSGKPYFSAFSYVW